MRLVRVRRLAILVIITSMQVTSLQTLAAGNPPCAPKFQNLGNEGVAWASDLDRLVAFESEFGKAENVINDHIKTLSLPPKDSFRIANEKHLEILKLRAQYETLADDLLSEDAKRMGSFESRLEQMRERLERTTDIRAITANPAVREFKDLIETPTLLRAETRYDVPQASGVAGSASAKKVSVSFTREVLDYFFVDLERGSRFLRAIQKGYIGSGSGSGIVRITDHHEALVEIKVIGGKEGHQRLIGCRRNDGYIEILKVYEKRNEGGGGSLKHFAELCDP